jgi:octanoyl-[GcvH]:protein N-octanoyltransferase
VSSPFGGPFRTIDDTELPAELRSGPQGYAGWVKQQMTGLWPGDEGVLRLRRPRPTAAFSPQDTAHPAYERIKALARARGFEPIERGTGGRLTLFDENALAITIVSPHATPHEHTMRRYELLSLALARALISLGIDARVGELRDEYCPGKYSVNAEGRIKLVGVAQRMNQRCVQMGAIVSVTRSEAALAGLAEAYAAMGLAFNPDTYGAIGDFSSELTYAQVLDAFLASVTDLLRRA